MNFTDASRGLVGSERNVTTRSNEDDDPRDEYLANWEVATLAAMFLVALAGNSLVVVALCLRRYDTPRKSLTRMYFFVLHLSVADLLTAFLNILPQLAWEITFRFQGGPILCKLVKFGQPLGSYLSSYVLIATALDRYQAVRHPLAYCRVRPTRSRTMVYLAWSLSAVVCAPQAIVFSYVEASPGVWDCWATFDPPSGQRAYATWYAISVFIMPLVVLAYTYTAICIEIWNNTGITGEARGTQGGLPRPRTIISRAKINSIKQMIAVIGFYAASSSPFVVSLLWATWDPNAATSPFFSGAAFTILTLMSSLNSCVNPWIYLTLNRQLFRALISRVYPSSQSRKRQRRCSTAVENTRYSGIASFSGRSDKSHASRTSRCASSIPGRSDSSNKELRSGTGIP